MQAHLLTCVVMKIQVEGAAALGGEEYEATTGKHWRRPQMIQFSVTCILQIFVKFNMYNILYPNLNHK